MLVVLLVLAFPVRIKQTSTTSSHNLLVVSYKALNIMTAVRNTLDETMTKQEVGYGAIEDTNTPETKTTLDQLTTTRTTYGMLLLVMSVFLVIGAGAGATRSSLRSDTTAVRPRGYVYLCR